jgi:broad specificity phosphatase PhoE
MRQNWPERLYLVRHGQSQGNVARDAADEAGLHEIGIEVRDVDVPLSQLGIRQAEAAGRWFASLRAAPRPPGAAGRMARGASGPGAARPALAGSGIRERFPEEAAHRRLLGKFYHRPPGGESWADVILRLRSMLNTINLHYCNKRVLIVCHQVVVLCFRYILEELDEEAILRIDKQGDVLNCGIASYEFEPDARGTCVPELSMWNYGAPLEEEGAAKTSEPDVMAGTR